MLRCWMVCCLLLACGSAVLAEDAPAAKQDSEVKPSVVTLEDRFGEVEMPAKTLDAVTRLGERLTYLIKYKGIPAGQAVFSVKRVTKTQSQRAYYLTLETESNDAISMLYPVRDKVKSYVSAETGHSLLFQRTLSEGDYRADDSLEFDYEQNLQYYRAVDYDGNEHTRREKPPRPIPGHVQDPLSVLYYLRHFPLAVGESQRVLIGTRKRTNVLKVTALREEEVTIPGVGVFDANVIRLANGEEGTEYDAEVFVSSGDITLWVEKHTNMPLILNVGLPRPLGSATGVLHNSRNSPLNAHVKRAAE
ncbi:MAG: DUF3108 domain-containing protein [Planctomycetota bacterium]